MKYAFAGDREISCNILKFLINKGFTPDALLVADGISASHADELIAISGLSENLVFKGKDVIKDSSTQALLRDLNVDYIFGIHYPYIIPTEILNVPKVGFLNLHPAYLPFNKGWNTPSWAILDNSIYGATLHFMSEKLDEGDIVHQKKMEAYAHDTANTLYARVLKLEEEVFYESFESLVQLKPSRTKQEVMGTSYKKSDLQKIREFSLDENIKVQYFLDKVRALTTNNPDEIAYFINDNKKIGVKVEFILLDD